MAGSPQNTNMDLEYFKPIEPLGSPGGSAKPVKLAAGAAALAAAAAALFFFYVVTTALHIGTTTARVEIRLVNRQDHQAIYWQLVQGPPPELPPPGTPTLLEEDQELLHLEDLTPCTEYTILFLEYDQHGDPVIVHTFTFVTDCGGTPQIPDSQEPPAEPPVTPPEDPPVTPPETPPVTPPEDPPVTPPVNPPVDPPVTPPYVPGGGGGDDSPPKTPGYFPGDVTAHLNRFDYTLDYSTVLPESLPVTIVIEDFTPGSYDFEITDFFLYADEEPLEEGEGRDYIMPAPQISRDGTMTFTLNLKPEWISQGYVALEANISGASFDNGIQVGDLSHTYVRGQINFRPGYSVAAITGLLGKTFLGMTVDSIYLSTDGLEGESLTEAVDGQTVTVALDLTGPATANGSIQVSGAGDVYVTPDANKGSISVETGDMWNYLLCSFTMPKEDVTETDLDLVLTATPSTISETDAPLLSAPAPAAPAETAASEGPGSVGPLFIGQGIHGLEQVHTLFHTADQTNAAQLAAVPAGETVYLEIFLQGAATESFRLGAAFAPSPRIADLRVVDGYDVKIAETTYAYLRISFTMPAGPVTAADIGFIAFTANQ